MKQILLLLCISLNVICSDRKKTIYKVYDENAERESISDQIKHQIGAKINENKKRKCYESDLHDITRNTHENKKDRLNNKKRKVAYNKNEEVDNSLRNELCIQFEKMMNIFQKNIKLNKEMLDTINIMQRKLDGIRQLVTNNSEAIESIEEKLMDNENKIDALSESLKESHNSVKLNINFLNVHNEDSSLKINIKITKIFQNNN